MNYWLIKSEPDCYSIDNLKHDKKTAWAGVRNFQARNFMRDRMKPGDLALFYHSSTKLTGIYGIAKVSSKPIVDVTQFDPKDDHYDPKSKKENPTWMCVEFSFVSKFKEPLSLFEIKLNPELKGMVVTQVGSRLSIQPVSESHFTYIEKGWGDKKKG